MDRTATAETAWHISADKISYDTQQDIYIAERNVRITKDTFVLLADVVRFSPKTTKVRATGHVSLSSAEDTLSGTWLELDLSSEIGRIENGELVSTSVHFRITGESIQKTGKDTYEARGITVTTCGGNCPAWKITGKRLRVTMDDYATVTHGAFWVKNIPVLYFPLISFPAKIERQSGFLTPLVGQSDRQGLTYDQPLFWAIDPHSDATFYLRHMSKRGTQAGLEYRYAWDAQSKGTVMVGGFNDRKVDDGRPDITGESANWRYDDDDVLRPNSDRYWLRTKHDQQLPGGYKVELDLDLVSDQDYLHEFRAGHTGYDKAETYYRERFRRVLDRYDDPVRVNRLNIRNAWNSYSLNGEARWYDDVISRRSGVPGTTLHRLPNLSFSALKQKVLESPLYLDLDTEYTHFYRETGDRGHRLRAHTNLYLPYRVKDRVTLEPSLGLEQTVWYMDEMDGASAGMDRQQVSGTCHLGLDLSTALYRIYGIGSDNQPFGRKIKHIIRPRVSYAYTPAFSQDHHPSFDSKDRIPGANMLTYSLTSILILKSHGSGNVAEHDPDPQANGSSTQFRRILRLMLEQRYYMDEIPQPSSDPFSPIYGKLEFSPTHQVSVDMDAHWSTEDSAFLTRNAALSVYDDRGDTMSIEHRYTRDSAESVFADIQIALAAGLTTYGSFERNIRDNRRISQSIGLHYSAQCWSLDVRYAEEEDDSRIEFSVSLLGLSDF